MNQGLEADRTMARPRPGAGSEFGENKMRIAAGLIFAGAVSLLASSAAWSQSPPTKGATAAPQAAPAAAPAPAPPAAPARTRPPCNNPDALGIARTVEIDTTGGPGFGFEHFKQLDFLRDKEVVLTFDDGPWPVNTPAVLKTLADECTTGIFFPIGKHATYYPGNPQAGCAAGHTVGSHTWSHATLINKKLTEQQRKDEIEKGFSAVKWAFGGKAPAPFFRFPALQHPPEMVTYLGERNIGIFSCDLNSFDFKARKAQAIIDTVMTQGRQARQGHHPDARLPEAHGGSPARTSEEAEGRRLQGGAMRAKAPVQTLAQYDEDIVKDAEAADRELASGVQRRADDFGIARRDTGPCRRCASKATSSSPRTACWPTPATSCRTN